jgi:hypothetical protein
MKNKKKTQKKLIVEHESGKRETYTVNDSGTEVEKTTETPCTTYTLNDDGTTTENRHIFVRKITKVYRK